MSKTMSLIDAAASAWITVITECAGNVEACGVDIPIPKATPEMMISVCDQAIALLKKTGTVVHRSAPIYIVGDVHGSLIDLLRIFTEIGRPANVDYLFLGDYVDRGFFSIEVITLLLIAYVLNPKKVTLLRGNHELPEINKVYGFYGELKEVYADRADQLYDKFNETFSYLPIAAVVEREMFCVHGGICPNFNVLSQIEVIPKPINVQKHSLIKNMLWADPSTRYPLFAESSRGESVEYGDHAVKYFYETTKMNWIIRGHQCVQHGVKLMGIKNVVTVFSSSSYSENDNNESGVLFIDYDRTMSHISYPAIPKKLNRQNVVCYSLTNPREEMNIDLASTKKVPMSLSVTSINGVSGGRRNSISNINGFSFRKESQYKPRFSIPNFQSETSIDPKVNNAVKQPKIVLPSPSRPSMNDIRKLMTTEMTIKELVNYNE